jgi:uncharacterized protein (DUF934 family)
MRVIKDRQIVDDAWEILPPDAAIPASGDRILSLHQWNAVQEGPAPEHQGKLGVLLKSDELPEQILGLERAPLVAIEFPKFGDGRGYSSARLLRDRLGYRGELRAVGDVLRDQLFYMHRVGIDSFALKPGKDIEGALSAFDDFSVAYQAAADDPRPLFRRVSR